MLSKWELNGGSSLQFDDEGTSELAAEIYQLERENLELGAVLGNVSSFSLRLVSSWLIDYSLFRRVITVKSAWE